MKTTVTKQNHKEKLKKKKLKQFLALANNRHSFINEIILKFSILFIAKEEENTCEWYLLMKLFTLPTSRNVKNGFKQSKAEVGKRNKE